MDTLSPVMVEVMGPDFKGHKRNCASFYKHKEGCTTFSASGVCIQLDPCSALGRDLSPFMFVLVPTSLLSPFLVPGVSGSGAALHHEAQVFVQLDTATRSTDYSNSDRSRVVRVMATFIGIIALPNLSISLKNLLVDVRAATGKKWEVGWNLQTHEYNTEHEQSSLALLRIPTAESSMSFLIAPEVLPLAGNVAMVFGSPFGCLAPGHFSSFIVKGVVSNTFSRQRLHGSSHTYDSTCPLFTLDIACFPGMEGAVVATDQLKVVGILLPPLSRSDDKVQVPLAMNFASVWPEVLSHLQSQQQLQCLVCSGDVDNCYTASIAPASRSGSQWQGERSLYEKAAILLQNQQSSMQRVVNTCSVVMVCVHGRWASGIAVHQTGIVLTNRHLLMPDNTAKLHTKRPLHCSVRITGKDGSFSWHDAQSTYVFSNHLDLAVVEILPQDPHPRIPYHTTSTLGHAGHTNPYHHTHASSHMQRSATKACMGLPPDHSNLGGSACAPVACGASTAPFSGPIIHALLSSSPLTPPSHPSPASAAPAPPLTASPLLPYPAPQRAAASEPSAVAATQHGASAPLSPRPPAQAVPYPQHAASHTGLPCLQLQPVTMADNSSQVAGRPCWVVGHGLFGPGLGLLPSVTAGTIAKVVGVPGQPATLMLTTATVHSGASGGAVLDAQGHLVGLVTSNARHASGTTLPNLNFCIALDELRPVIDVIGRVREQHGDLRSALSKLDVADVVLQRVWALQPFQQADTELGVSARGACGNMQSDGFRQPGCSFDQVHFASNAGDQGSKKWNATRSTKCRL